MATNTIKARHVLAAKTLTAWTSETTVPLKGETCYEITQKEGSHDFILKMKVGNGVDVYKDLPYISTDVVSGDNWIVSTESNGVVTLTHADPQAENSSKSRQTSGANVVTGLSVDAKGHVRSSATVKEIKGGAKITVSNDASSITVAHQNTTRSNTTGTQRAFEGNVITGVTTDDTGHVTGVETSKLPANPVPSNNVTGAAALTADTIILGNNNYSVKTSSKTITTTAPSSSSTDSTVPTSKAVQSAIDAALTAALKYKGTIEKQADLPASPSTGDVYVVKTAFGGYEAGDYFIYNGTSWDVINGENQVSDKDATLAFGTKTTVATVDGTDLHVTMPANPVNSLNVSDPTASGTSLTFIDTIKQENGKITATKKTVTTTNTYTTTADTTNDAKPATPAAIRAAIDTLDVSSVGGSGKYISAISETNGKISATASDISNVVGSGKLQVVANSGATGVATPFNANSSADTVGLNFINGTYTTAVVTAVTDKAPTITFNHNSTTRSDTAGTTALAFGAAVVTGVTTNATGHLTGITTAPLPADPSVNNYSSVAVAAQSTATANSAGTTSAVTLTPASKSDKLNISTGNKWVTINAINGAANADTLKFGHAVGTISGTSGGFNKISWDAAGHVTGGTAVTKSDIPALDVDHTSAKASTDGTTKSYLDVKVQGTSHKVEDVYTDILRDGNLTLIIDGNF